MKYPLQDLLRVRKFREEKQANELTKRRGAVEEAERVLAERKKELEDYIQWRIEREKQLYDEVMNQSITVHDLDDLKLKIQMLRDGEAAYEQRILEAKQALEQAREALAKAQEAYRAAVRDTEKIEQHKEMWAQEQAREYEANQEKELEDFRVRTLETEEVNDG